MRHFGDFLTLYLRIDQKISSICQNWISLSTFLGGSTKFTCRLAWCKFKKIRETVKYTTYLFKQEEIHQSMNIDTICATPRPPPSSFSVSGSLGIQHVGKQFIRKLGKEIQLPESSLLLLLLFYPPAPGLHTNVLLVQGR